MEKNKKEGVSVKELENFARKHRFEVFLSVTFILACFFSFIMWGPGLAIGFAALGAVLGVIFPEKIDKISKKCSQFVFKQEEMTQLVLGIVVLIIAIFLPPLIFLKLGAHGGRDIYLLAVESCNSSKK